MILSSFRASRLAASLALLLSGPLAAEPVIPPHLVVSAHRGGAAYAPENTLPAFHNAVRLGVDDLEADTLITRDGQLVLIHDDTLERTTDCEGFVVDFDYAALAQCDAAYWFTPGEPVTRGEENGNHPLRGQGVRIPRLEELFDYLAALYEAGQRVPTATVEIKVVPDRRDQEGVRRMDPTAYPTASRLVELINEDRYALIRDHIIVQSFWPPALQLVKELDPNIRTLFLSTPDAATLSLENLGYTLAGGHDFVSPQHRTPDFTAEFVQAAHLAHKRVIPWTVDQREDFERVAELGVDGMITNFPGCMLQLQGRLADGTRMTPGQGKTKKTLPNEKPRSVRDNSAVPDTPACPGR